MNRILSILAMGAALALSACGTTQRGPYAAPQTGVVRQHVEGAGEKVAAAKASTTKAQAHAKTAKAKVEQIEKIVPKTSENATLILSLKQEIDSLTDELLNTQLALQDAQTELEQAKVEIPKLQEQINTQTTQLNNTTVALNQRTTERDIAVKKYHKLKFWIIGVAAAAVVFLMYALFSFAAFSPPLLWVTLAAPAAVSTFLLFYL
jgi:septal ring factor EnvC (AmiA/AmiB activator)